MKNGWKKEPQRREKQLDERKKNLGKGKRTGEEGKARQSYFTTEAAEYIDDDAHQTTAAYARSFVRSVERKVLWMTRWHDDKLSARNNEGGSTATDDVPLSVTDSARWGHDLEL